MFVIVHRISFVTGILKSFSHYSNITNVLVLVSTDYHFSFGLRSCFLVELFSIETRMFGVVCCEILDFISASWLLGHCFGRAKGPLSPLSITSWYQKFRFPIVLIDNQGDALLVTVGQGWESQLPSRPPMIPPWLEERKCLILLPTWPSVTTWVGMYVASIIGFVVLFEFTL